METNFNTEQLAGSEKPTRPQFLKVLCILSFLGSGLGIIGAIWNYISVRASTELYQNIGNAEGEDPLGIMSSLQDSLIKAVENAIPNLIIGILCSIICLVGVFMMWQLKKKGFFIYSIGELAYPISTFILSGGGLIGGIGAAFSLIVALVFVVLYGMNYKHLKL